MGRHCPICVDNSCFCRTARGGDAGADARGCDGDRAGRRPQRECRVRQRQSRHHAHHGRRQPRRVARDRPGGFDAVPRGRGGHRVVDFQRHVHRFPAGVFAVAAGRHPGRVLRVRRRDAARCLEYGRVLRLLRMHDPRGAAVVLRSLRDAARRRRSRRWPCSRPRCRRKARSPCSSRSCSSPGPADARSPAVLERPRRSRVDPGPGQAIADGRGGRYDPAP